MFPLIISYHKATIFRFIGRNPLHLGPAIIHESSGRMFPLRYRFASVPQREKGAWGQPRGSLTTTVCVSSIPPDAEHPVSIL